MNKILVFLFLCTMSLTISGCAVFGKSGVQIAPYTVLEKEGPIEIRHYERLLLVTTSMPKGMGEQNSPFYKLFDYISGENEKAQKISMTAPVFMGQKDQKTETMSFVLPKNFDFKTAPKPQDPEVKLEELTNYTVAAITFDGYLRQKNINKHRALVEEWIMNNGYDQIGAVKAAGYNPPFTIPAFRRNEILIPVKKP